MESRGVETRICRNGHEYEYRKQCLICKRAQKQAKREAARPKKRAVSTDPVLKAEREAFLAREAARVDDAISRVKRQQESRATFWLNVRHKPIHLTRSRER